MRAISACSGDPMKWGAARGKAGGDGLGEVRLSRARLTADQERPLERQRAVDRGFQRGRGEVLVGAAKSSEFHLGHILQRRALISQSRPAAASSSACGAGSVSRQRTKYFPVTPCACGEVARYTDVSAPCSREPPPIDPNPPRRSLVPMTPGRRAFADAFD